MDGTQGTTVMLNALEVLKMFGGIKDAAKYNRNPTPDEIGLAIQDAHSLLASVVSDLSDIACYCNEHKSRI